MRVDSGLPLNFPNVPNAPAHEQPLRLINEPRRALDAAGASALLGRAWQAVLGNAPAPESVAVLTAQWALETDTGRAMQGNNFGGIKAAPGAAGASFHTVEGHGAGRREVTARFRVYGTAYAGAEDYVRLLASRYPAALAAAHLGDVPGFAKALAQGGYFTADPHAYARGLEERFHALVSGSPEAGARPPVRLDLAVSEAAIGGLLRALSRESESA